MPFMLELRHVAVFGGERGEGLQKTEKLALYADSVLVVPEQAISAATIDFPVGPVRYVAEKLSFGQAKQARVAPTAASRWNIGRYLRGADFVCSDLADQSLNRRIAALCKKRGIRCNIIDHKELGDTWFMSLVDVPGLLVGISSRGECAYASRAARESLHGTLERQGRVSQILSRVRAVYHQAPAKPGAEAAAPKGALAMLETLNHHPEFQALCQREDWAAAEQFALELAANFQGGGGASSAKTGPKRRAERSDSYMSTEVRSRLKQSRMPPTPTGENDV